MTPKINQAAIDKYPLYPVREVPEWREYIDHLRSAHIDGFSLAQSEIDRLTGIIEELVKDDNMFFAGVKNSYKEQRWQQFKKEKKLS